MNDYEVAMLCASVILAPMMFMFVLVMSPRKWQVPYRVVAALLCAVAWPVTCVALLIVLFLHTCMDITDAWMGRP